MVNGLLQEFGMETAKQPRARGKEDSLRESQLTRAIVQRAIDRFPGKMVERLGVALLDAWDQLEGLESERASMARTAVIDLEREVLGALIQHHATAGAGYAYEHLDTKDFLLPEHGVLFEELRRMPKVTLTQGVVKAWLSENGEALQRLRRAGGWQAVCGVMGWLTELVADRMNIPLPDYVPWFCGELRERRLKDAATALAQAMEQNGKPQSWYKRQLERLNEIPRLKGER